MNVQTAVQTNGKSTSNEYALADHIPFIFPARITASEYKAEANAAENQ